MSPSRIKRRCARPWPWPIAWAYPARPWARWWARAPAPASSWSGSSPPWSSTTTAPASSWIWQGRTLDWGSTSWRRPRARARWGARPGNSTDGRARRGWGSSTPVACWGCWSRSLLPDQPLPTLQVGVADRGVEIHRGLLDALERLQGERPIIDDVDDLHEQASGDEPHEVAQRIHGAVHRDTDAVADGHGRQERQDQVGPRPHPPDAERLPEVLPARLDVPFLLGHVPEAADSDCGIDEEARDLTSRPRPLGLEQAV